MKVNSKTYDNAIHATPIQDNIDTYYVPKELVAKRRISLLLNTLNPKEDEKILDIGCGVGTFAFHSAKAGALATGIDYSEESIKLAQKLTAKFGVDNKTTFLVSSIDKLPFADDSFDKIIAADIIEHISDSDKDLMLKEMKRVLKDDGFIIIFTPNKIRDDIGLLWKKITFKKIAEWNVAVHFGLITRKNYEQILKANKMQFKFKNIDLTRPILAKIPIIKDILGLNLLWVIRKK